jgi:hypothetical protein
MDTLKDRQILEDMVEEGEMPWRKFQSLSTKREVLIA